MNSKILLVIRIVFALFLLFFGLNKFFQFMSPPPPPEEAMAYWTGLSASKTMTLVAIVEIAAGLALLLNKYASLMMLVLMSVSVNAVLYHATLDPGSIGMAVALLALNVIMLYAYKDHYKSLL